uniref:RanBP2-type domain-containing protein n=1 Tax=Lotharella globosa TaxID=91324 RepID=A0A7S3YRM2_9EUKA
MASRKKDDARLWACPRCTLENSEQVLVCKACCLIRPHDKKMEGKKEVRPEEKKDTVDEWSCSYCTLSNPKGRVYCLVCRKKRKGYKIAKKISVSRSTAIPRAKRSRWYKKWKPREGNPCLVNYDGKWVDGIIVWIRRDVGVEGGDGVAIKYPDNSTELIPPDMIESRIRYQESKKEVTPLPSPGQKASPSKNMLEVTPPSSNIPSTGNKASCAKSVLEFQRRMIDKRSRGSLTSDSATVIESEEEREPVFEDCQNEFKTTRKRKRAMGRVNPPNLERVGESKLSVRDLNLEGENDENLVPPGSESPEW